MWLGLGTVVEAEDAFDDAVKLGRQMNHSDASASNVSGGGMLVLFEFHAESVADRGHGSSENYGAAGGALFFYREFVFVGERLDAGDIGGIGAVALLEIPCD